MAELAKHSRLGLRLEQLHRVQIDQKHILGLFPVMLHSFGESDFLLQCYIAPLLKHATSKHTLYLCWGCSGALPPTDQLTSRLSISISPLHMKECYWTRGSGVDRASAGLSSAERLVVFTEAFFAFSEGEKHHTGTGKRSCSWECDI